MKTVQDKDGNIIQVADDAPCHAGKNGALPVLLDATLDANIFAEIAVKEAEYTAKAPQRALAKVIGKRRAEYGSLAEQLERLIENGLDVEQTRVADIKARHPKP